MAKIKHAERLTLVLQVLRKKALDGKLEKCKFFTQVAFLGYVTSKEGIQVDQFKIETMKNWPIVPTITKVRSFHGLASFYR